MDPAGDKPKLSSEGPAGGQRRTWPLNSRLIISYDRFDDIVIGKGEIPTRARTGLSFVCERY
jgi:hypothetical protein